jgi:serine/threonine protein kinase
VKEEEIGSGANGTTYLIKKKDKKYILKVQFDQDTSRKELEILEELKGMQYITQLVEHTTEEGYLFMVITFGSRGTVLSLIDESDYFQRHQNLMKFMRQLLIGYKELHNLGKIHGDIKYNNIVVTQDYEPMIIDFDLTRVINTKNYASGTFFFMSPEIIRAYQTSSKVEYSEEVDVYALGVLLYTMVTKEHPYDLESDLYSEMMTADIQFKAGQRESFYKLVFSSVKPESSRISFKDFAELVEHEFVKPSPVLLQTDMSYKMVDFANENERKLVKYVSVWSYLDNWFTVGFLAFFIILVFGLLILKQLPKD